MFNVQALLGPPWDWTPKKENPQPLKTSLIPVFRLEFIDLITKK